MDVYFHLYILYLWLQEIVEPPKKTSIVEEIINHQLFEWANELRLSGNEAAHNIESTFTNNDAKDILDFTIAILDYSYSFQDKFLKFKERRNS